VSHTKLIATQPDFSSFNHYTSINDGGQVAFTGSHPSLGAGVFVGNENGYERVATTPDFDITGIRPSINNLDHVAFYGVGGSEGIHVWKRATGPELVVPLEGSVYGIDGDSRVALNDNDAVAFMGTTEGDIRTLFRCDYGAEVDVIVRIGDELNGSPAVAGVELWDGLNNRGDIVFWATHDDGSESTQVAVGSPLPSSGHVLFADAYGTPISGAAVWAYLIGQYNEITPIGDEPNYTDEHGKYERPDAFTDPQYDGRRLGLLAEVGYWDPGADLGYYAVNYPNNDPFPPKGQTTGTEVVRIPLPVVLQGGWLGGVDTWTVFGDFLRRDPATRPSEQQGLPAFMTFTMPSNDPDEQPAWGYHNGAPPSHHQHNDNVHLLDDYINGRVREALRDLIPDDQERAHLPIHLCGHSMGGTITRGWLHYKSGLVRRYVSFDGVHGGTTFFFDLGAGIRGFAEWYMNGYNEDEDLPPINPGWDYFRKVAASTKYLLLSASRLGANVVNPNCSALGMGRTMRDKWSPDPNDHKGRFIGGLEWHTNFDHWSIKEDANVIYEVARFLAEGYPPQDAYVSGDAYDCQDNPPCPLSDDIPAKYATGLEADVQEVAEIPFFLDENLSISVLAVMEGADCAFDLLGPDDQSWVPGDADIIDFEGGQIVTFSVDAPPIGLATLQLAAGDEPAAAFVGVTFANGRWLRLEVPEEPVSPQTPVTVIASMRDADDTVIVGTGGSAEVTLVLPDESEQVLPLFDDGQHDDGEAGDGVYANTFDTTSLGGRYMVNGHAQITLDDEVVERTAIGMFVVDSSPAFLVGVTDERPVDEDSNGKIDRLEIDIEVQVDEAGDYQVMAVLQDYMEEMISEDHVQFEVQDVPSGYTVTLQFDAGTLVAHGVDGPWTLTDIQLIDDDQVLVADTLADYVTAPYDLDDFEPPPAPILIMVLPDYGRNNGGNEVILDGDYLGPVMAIEFGGQSVPEFQVFSDTSIRVIVPAAPTPDGGSVDIGLTTPWHNVTFPDAYTYLEGPEAQDTGGKVEPDSIQPIPPP